MWWPAGLVIAICVIIHPRDTNDQNLNWLITAILVNGVQSVLFRVTINLGWGAPVATTAKCSVLCELDLEKCVLVPWAADSTISSELDENISANNYPYPPITKHNTTSNSSPNYPPAE